MSVYACSDLHGYLDLYKQFKEFLRPEDKVYFLGDAGDRGPESWETIKTILNDSQFIYLMGNHELMLVEAIDEYLNNQKYDTCDYEKYSLLCANGGQDTFSSWLEEKDKKEWLIKLKSLPYYCEYKNKSNYRICMTHAGFTPQREDQFTPYKLVWNRKHFYNKWPEGEENTIILHGHTPLIHLADDLNMSIEELEPGAIWYANEKKVCIDNGTFFTGYSCLLNLDTFDEHIFSFS